MNSPNPNIRVMISCIAGPQPWIFWKLTMLFPLISSERAVYFYTSAPRRSDPKELPFECSYGVKRSHSVSRLLWGMLAENLEQEGCGVLTSTPSIAAYRHQENDFEKSRHLDVSVHLKLTLITIILNGQLLS